MNDTISILDVLRDTTVDGPGFRTAIYAAGCKHQCLECHNPQSWNITNGMLHSISDLLKTVKEDEFANVTFTGGDPLMQVDEFAELAYRIKAETKKNIWCYTGFTYEQIIISTKLSQILPHIDVLVDGQYIKALRNEDLQFRGSSNQRIVDIQQSTKTGKICMWNDESDIRLSQLYSQHCFL